MDTPACCAELAVLLIDSAIPPASAAAFISTALSLEITAKALSADSLKPFKLDVKYSVASAESIMPILLRIAESFISSFVSSIERPCLNHVSAASAISFVVEPSSFAIWL